MFIYKKIFLLLVASLFQYSFVYAQQVNVDTEKIIASFSAKVDSSSPPTQIDLFDLFRVVFKPKHSKKVYKENIDGPFITTIPYPGYSISTGVAGVLPLNIAFYTDKKEKGCLSFFNTNFQYTQYRQVLLLSLSNLFLAHDKWRFIGDWRLYNFPTITFGLGSRTSMSDASNINYWHVRMHETILYRVEKSNSIGIGYHLDYHWSIRDIAFEHGTITDFQRYGFNKASTSSGLSLNFIFDSRSNPNNPDGGFYFSTQFRINRKEFLSTANSNSLFIDVRKYFLLPSKWRMVFACWAYAAITLNGNPPYLDLPGTGWDDYNNTGRGYALGRYRGLHLLYLESEFRFNILRNGLLGGVVFGNLQTVSEWPANNFALIQPGAGIGVRIKMNKRTNTNSAVDYGFGTGGSRGLAFNFNEVF